MSNGIRPRGWRWAPVRVRPDEAYLGNGHESPARPRSVPSTPPAKASRRRLAGCIAAGVVAILWIGLAWAFMFALVAKYLP